PSVAARSVAGRGRWAPCGGASTSYMVPSVDPLLSPARAVGSGLRLRVAWCGCGSHRGPCTCTAPCGRGGSRRGGGLDPPERREGVEVPALHRVGALEGAPAVGLLREVRLTEPPQEEDLGLLPLLVQGHDAEDVERPLVPLLRPHHEVVVEEVAVGVAVKGSLHVEEVELDEVAPPVADVGRSVGGPAGETEGPVGTGEPDGE